MPSAERNLRKKEKDSVTGKKTVATKVNLGKLNWLCSEFFITIRKGDQSLREESRLKNRMRELGFSQSDITDAFSKLELEEMIRFSGGSDMACYYSLTQKGMRWCLDNKEAIKEKQFNGQL